MRRVSCIVAAVLVAFCLLSVVPFEADAAGTMTLAQLQEKFPNGSYWNHYVSNVSQAGDSLGQRGDESFADTVTSSPCASHSSTDPYYYVGKYDCNYFDGGWQCFGFARKLGYNAFGTKVSTWPVHSSVANIKPGDVIRFWSPDTDQTNGHSVFVIGVSGSIITVGEANLYNDPCKIRWGHRYDLSSAWKVEVYSAPRALEIEVSASWSDCPNRVSIGSTNAVLAHYCHLSGVNATAVSNVGIYIYDYKGAEIRYHIEPANLGTYTTFDIWFNLNEELGFSIEPGTKYQYKFFSVVNGEKYYSPLYTFTSTGTHSHKYDGGKVTANPTCGKTGTKVYTCTTCGATKTETIAKLTTHSYNGGAVTKQPTCKDTGVKTYTCTICNGTKTESIAKTTDHKYGSWTKVNDTTHKHTCSVCQKEETASHSWNGGAVTKQPTCKETGVKTYTCTTCNGTKTESIAKTTDHKYGSWTKVNDTTHKHTCSVCQKEETASHNYNSGAVTKLPTCKDYGVKTYTCSTCNGTKTENVAKTTDHKYGSWTKINDSTHQHICSVCKKEETASHSWNGGVVTKQPTCKEAGVKTYTCTVCNGTRTESVAKLTTHTYDNVCDTSCNVCGQTRTVPHNYSTKWSADKTNHWHECSVCQHKKDLSAHTPGAAATETTAQTCTACGYVIKAALGHTHKYTSALTYDGANHWYSCSGCSEKKDVTKHSFENACDTKCDACGYTRTVTHNYNGQWSTDKNSHWYVCSVCGDKKDVAAHEPGAAATETTAQTCTICDYVIQAALGHTHNFNNTWTMNNEKHWRDCACGEKTDEADHTWDGGACSGCGMINPVAPTEPEVESTTVPATEPASKPNTSTSSKKDDPAGVVVLCLLGAAIGGGIVFIKKKKRS